MIPTFLDEISTIIYNFMHEILTFLWGCFHGIKLTDKMVLSVTYPFPLLLT